MKSEFNVAAIFGDDFFSGAQNYIVGWAGAEGLSNPFNKDNVTQLGFAFTRRTRRLELGKDGSCGPLNGRFIF